MNTRRSECRFLALGASLLALGCLAGCNLPEPQADPVRHFTLSVPRSTPAVPGATAVRPVRLAGHLRSRAMAVRVSENEVVYLEDMRWAEPLDEAITQLLRNRLRQVGGGATVSVTVQRCELDRSAGNEVVLAATYTVTPPAGEARTAVFTATPRKWAGGDQAALVGLMRDAVGELADAIAGALEAR